MSLGNNKPRVSRCRLWAGLLIWSVLVAVVYVIWQAQKDVFWSANDDGARARVRLAIGGTMVLVFTLIASYVVVRAWNNLPTRRKTRFWLAIISIIAGSGCVSWLFYQNMQLGQVMPLSQVLLQLVIWSLVFLTGLLFLYSAAPFFRWLFSWRILKRCLLALGLLAVLVALFYGEENWRGRRDWNECQRELEVKGEKLNLADFAPPSVPDEENFAMAPIMVTSYIGRMHRAPNDSWSPNMDVSNRLLMTLERTNYSFSTNVSIGLWPKAMLTDLKPWQEYYRAIAVTNVWNCDNGPTNMEIIPLVANEFPIAAQPQSPSADVLLALSRYQQTLDELQHASERPHSRFPINYTATNPMEIFLPHLQSLKEPEKILQLRAIAKLQDGQTASALQDIKLMLRLADSVRSEPFLISHLVQTTIIDMSLQPVWEGLAEQHWSDAELTELMNELQKLDFVSDWQFSIRAERAAELSDIDYLKKHRDETAAWLLFAVCPESVEMLDRLDNCFPNMPESFNLLVDTTIRLLPMDCINRSIYHLPPAGWYDQNKTRIANVFQEQLLSIADVNRHLISQQRAKNFSDWLEINRSSKNVSPNNILIYRLLPAMSATTTRFTQAQNSVDMALLACALERYRLAHGEYPETLAALVPSLLEKIPTDVVNGEPLHYQRTDNGRFKLYSIGWNGVDDGGVIGTNQFGRIDKKTGDWVWQYPAKL